MRVEVPGIRDHRLQVAEGDVRVLEELTDWGKGGVGIRALNIDVAHHQQIQVTHSVLPGRSK
jgi:hypothetical protein